MNIQEITRKIMDNYLNQKNNTFKGNSFNSMMAYDLPEIFYNELELDRSRYLITASCGKGNWATIPWIAIFDKTITTSATRGYYIVVLFRSDMKGLYISLSQGYTWFSDHFKPKEARENIKQISEKIRKELNIPETFIDLKCDNELARGYELGNIYSKYYENDLSTIKEDIWKMLEYLYNVESLMKNGWESFNWENIDNLSLTNIVVKAMITLHKTTKKEWLPLQEIYNEVEKVTGMPNANAGASIRATLQKHCSQTETYTEGTTDLFEVRSIGAGEWKYKDFFKEERADIKLDYSKLQNLIESYINNFDDYRKKEVYKWEAIKHFQDTWDINAENFASMLNNSLSKSYNLLNSYMYFPMGMIVEFAKKDPQTTRDMFKTLFDEEKSLNERCAYFIEKSDELLNKYWEKGKSHYQDAHTLSVYLTFMYPEKYYMYKSSVDNKVAKTLKVNLYDEDKIVQMTNYYKLCDLVLDYIKDNENLINMHKNALNENCYLDEKLHVLTWDLLHYGGTKYKEKKYWLYAPGENARFWQDCLANGVMLLGWDKIKDLSLLTTKKEINDELKRMYGNDGSMKNDTNALYQFAYEMEEGDVIIAKQGIHTLLGYGEVVSEYYYDSSRETYQHARKVRWIKTGKWNVDQDKYGIVHRKTLTDLTPYDNYPIKLLNIMNDKEMKTNESEGKDINYYWLNANPRMWNFSDYKVGEEQEYTAIGESGFKRRIYQNFLDAKVGDILIVYESSPSQKIVGLSKITREVDNEGILGFQKIEEFTNPIPYKDFIDAPELENMEYKKKNFVGSLFKLEFDEYEFLMDLIREANPIEKNKEIDKYTKEDFLKDVYIEDKQYEELKSLLLRKKNIILQGAPGVGKTYMAKRLAYSINGEKDPEKVQAIQFHQSYSYEDFIEGFRPVNNGFELEKGVFYNFCKKAKIDSDKKYFFIIDEINRGNLSKIFGELLMLIENDKRGEKLTLAYSKENFSVPENVYIIGMMNTADRSLAIMDYALRRRFSFYNVEPAFENEKFKQYQYGLNSEYLNQTIEKIKKLNEEIEQDPSMGKGFKIGHSYFCNLKEDIDNNIYNILKYEIVPMIEEYWFDNYDKYENWKKVLLGE